MSVLVWVVWEALLNARTDPPNSVFWAVAMCSIQQAGSLEM